MATLWGSIEQDIQRILLEDGGWQLGLITTAQFYQIAGQVILDFCSKTGLIKKIFNIPLQFGIPTYEIPDTCSEIIACAANEQYIEETSGFYLDNQDPLWHQNTGQVQAYREDELNPKMLEVNPTPNVEGYQVTTAPGNDGYGVLSSTSAPNDFDVKASTLGPGYGTQAAADQGDVYVETTNPGYGVRASIVPSLGNLSIIGNALPSNITNLNAATYIELVPDSFVPYLKYAILARIWSQDGELKDLQRSAYAQARVNEGINLIGAIMTNAYQES